MKYFFTILAILGLTLFLLPLENIEAIPPSPINRVYEYHDVILVGEVTSMVPDYLPSNNLYEIRVIKYLKNTLATDTVTALGVNESNIRIQNVVFEKGDIGMFFLHDQSIREQDPPARYDISRESLIAKEEWFECNLFDKDIPAEHFPFGRGIIRPLFVQDGVSTRDTESLTTGNPITIQQDFVNHNTSPKEIDVHITLEHIDIPGMKPIFNETKRIHIEPCTTYKTVEWEFLPEQPGRYHLTFDTEYRGWGLGFSISENSRTGKSIGEKGYENSLPPLKQFKSGIDVSEIECKTSLVLIQKYDNLPACVTPDTKQELIERGWAKDAMQDNSVTLPFVFEVLKDDTVYDVEYDIMGGMVKDMVYGNDVLNLLVKLDTTDKGILTVSLPRDLIDAKMDYCPPLKDNPPDDLFFVLVNGEEVAYDEILTTPVTRTLQIPFPENTDEIEIIATCLI